MPMSFTGLCFTAQLLVAHPAADVMQHTAADVMRSQLSMEDFVFNHAFYPLHHVCLMPCPISRWRRCWGASRRAACCRRGWCCRRWRATQR